MEFGPHFSSFQCSGCEFDFTIPRNQSMGEDKLVWHFNNDGIYTVKSGYHTYLQRIREDSGQLWSTSHLWRKIWGAPVPNKLKHFIWRAAQDVLPTRWNLCSRNITEQLECPVCSATDETTTHIIRDFQIARSECTKTSNNQMLGRNWNRHCGWKNLTTASPRISGFVSLLQLILYGGIVTASSTTREAGNLIRWSGWLSGA